MFRNVYVCLKSGAVMLGAIWPTRTLCLTARVGASPDERCIGVLRMKVLQ